MNAKFVEKHNKNKNKHLTPLTNSFIWCISKENNFTKCKKKVVNSVVDKGIENPEKQFLLFFNISARETLGKKTHRLNEQQKCI